MLAANKKNANDDTHLIESPFRPEQRSIELVQAFGD
jgi:hypothetical protein